MIIVIIIIYTFLLFLRRDSDINEGGNIYLPSLLRGPRPRPAAPTVGGGAGASNHTSPSLYGSAESRPPSEYGTFEEEDALRPKTE